MKKKILGFSLLELMVVVAILGVLATVAVPRFNIFRARSRQAEAKSNLGVIFTLQEAFAIDHEQYYDGDSTTWGGTQMNDNGTEYGYGGSGDDGCDTNTRALNKLGFRLANCSNARYGYWMAGANEEGFTAIAHAPSDVVGDKRVFPGCDGTDGATLNKEIDDGTTNVPADCNSGANGAPNVGNTSYSIGDAWCLDGDRDMHNYRDITEFCEN